MPYTDIDGSAIVILSVAEATAIHSILAVRAADRSYGLTDIEQRVADKISRDLNLSPIITFKNKRYHDRRQTL